MENDLIFKILTQASYPLIYRHDRNIYTSHPQIDPLQLFKKCTIAALSGYWIGKLSQRRQKLFVLSFTLPFLTKFMYDEWKLSKELKKYTQFSLQSSLFNSLKTRNTLNSQKSAASLNKEIKHKIVRKIPKLQHKIYNASDFVSQLQPDYFK